MAGVIGLEDRQDSGYPLVEQDLYAVEEDADEGAFHHRLEGLQTTGSGGSVYVALSPLARATSVQSNPLYNSPGRHSVMGRVPEPYRESRESRVSSTVGPLQDANGHSFRPSRASRESSGTLPDFSRPRSPERPRSSGLSDKDSAHRRSSSKAGAGKRNGMRITIRDLSCTVVAKKKKLALLTSVTAVVAPGMMTALMGPSGSGKTTMLDILAGRKNTGVVTGTILYAGRAATPQFLRRHTGYVEQFDTLLENLTVSEMLMYTAELKLPLKLTPAAKRERVAVLLQQLALTACQSVKIGGAMNKGISGGQSKRVNIGIALVTSPRVLFLDEPTSGLDTYTSHQVMKVVKQLTEGDATITVCATIHSPSPYTFRLFDCMLILLHGQLCYFGSNGEEAVEFFEQQYPELPRFVQHGEHASGNPAEWLVNITTKADLEGQADRFAATYAASELRRDNDIAALGPISAAGVRSARVSVATLRELDVRSDTVTPFWHQYLVLLKYRLTSNYKDPKFISTRVSDKVVITSLMLLLYHGKGSDNRATNLLNDSTLLYMWSMLPAFAAAAYVPSLVMERPLFTRERADGLYLVIVYLCAKLTEEIGLAIIMSLVFSLSVYYGVHFQGAWFFFWLVYFTTQCIGIILAYAVASASADLASANTTVPAYVMTLLFFTGCLLRIPDIPGYARWYSYLDFIRYAWGAIMVNQYGESRPEFLPGMSILEYYSFENVNKWAYWGYECIILGVFFCLAYLALAYIRHDRR